MIYCGVVGNPIEHSLSPTIHQLFANQCGIELEYKKILSPLDSFAKTTTDFFEKGLGLNVTVPFKIEAFNFANDYSQYARIAGAVNTLKKENGKIIGHNTDGYGLVQDIQNNLNFSLKDKKILILGAGGATQGILLPILEQNPAKVLIANRTKEKSEKLAKQFSKYGFVCGFGLDKIKNESVDLVINATSTSLSESQLKLPTGVFENALCYDLFYGKQTKFMEFAKENGAIKIVDGLGMLVEQAANSFKIWHGEELKLNTEKVIDSLRS
ncbi:Shikimate 5-dehydrogenase I alpha [hydrothermal vent metagenome]|uniref:shikimate dehydrogenase (NADP(+)) n=1 Tax=hydrothermal vent metagenome TaxID=652676 RepID=A0A1W1CAI3_9ZZZZ